MKKVKNAKIFNRNLAEQSVLKDLGLTEKKNGISTTKDCYFLLNHLMLLMNGLINLMHLLLNHDKEIKVRFILSLLNHLNLQIL